MYFQHAPDIWRDFPGLSAGVAFVQGIQPTADVSGRLDAYTAVAADRLAGGPESDLPEIQAWRRTFSQMGLKPTQYRSASEALLRRFRKERALPRIHPVIDLCNAISLAFATPIAVFDVAQISGGIDVRRAIGDERYETFSGEIEHPERGEVIFVDEAGWVHARRWTNRQSGRSAVRESTSAVLIVAEALHETARDDVFRLLTTVSEELEAVWHEHPRGAMLSAEAPRFEF